MSTRSPKNPWFVPVLCLFILFISLFIYHSSNLGKSNIPLTGTDEDSLSMYQIPQDVLDAVNEAKTSGQPVLGIRADGPSYRIPVLMYHYVEYVQDKGDTIRISLDTNPAILDNEIKTLKDSGYTFLNATDLANILDGIKKLPDKPIVLTFDDGYGDFYTDAFPILKKYNVKAVQYVISGVINKPNYMTDSELSEIAKSGIIEIGAHTIHHPALAGIEPEVLKNEIEGSKVALEQKLGIAVTTFAYPYGSFDLAAIQEAKQVGFRTAMTTVPGTELGNYDRFFVNRLRPGGRTGQAFLDFIENSK